MQDFPRICFVWIFLESIFSTRCRYEQFLPQMRNRYRTDVFCLPHMCLSLCLFRTDVFCVLHMCLSLCLFRTDVFCLLHVCLSLCLFRTDVFCLLHVSITVFVSGQCCDEGKSFLEEIPDSPASKAFNQIIHSECTTLPLLT